MLVLAPEFNFKRGKMAKYFDELKRSMEYLASQDDTMFLGQAVAYKGTGMTNTLRDVDRSRLIEMPVNEDMQMGITNGLALSGKVPISIFPRWNFFFLATNQLVNHLDKFRVFSHEEYVPKVICRVGIGSVRPMHPQAQHIGDYTEAYRKMLSNVEIIRFEEPEQIFEGYHKAYHRDDGKSTILVEYGDFYNEK